MPPRVPLSQYETVSNKKESLGNSLYDLVFMSRGDRIRTCDLVLPKHPRYQAAPRPVTSTYYALRVIWLKLGAAVGFLLV